jgi:very-short-patch-repair endonuclease
MGSNPDRDLQRDHWLTSQGLRVLRFAATDVMSDLGSVMMLILVACRR